MKIMLIEECYSCPSCCLNTAKGCFECKEMKPYHRKLTKQHTYEKGTGSPDWCPLQEAGSEPSQDKESLAIVLWDRMLKCYDEMIGCDMLSEEFEGALREWRSAEH